MEAEMDLGAFDLTKYLTTIGERRRPPTTITRPTADLTFQQFGEGPWITNKRAKSEAKAKEYLGDLRIVGLIKIGEDNDKKREFGTLKLRDLKPEHIDQLTNELRKLPGRKKETMSGTRMNTLLLKVVRSVLNLAYAREYILKDPRGSFESQPEEEPDIDPLSFDEMLAFLAALPEPKWVRFYTVAFGTGLRPSELLALQWHHIDWQRTLLLIRQGFVDGRLTLLKTKGSRREVDMLPSVQEALEQHRAETQGKGHYVFSNVDGGPLHWDNLRNRIWNPTLAHSGLRHRNPYQTRHTFASLMLQQGEDPGWVSQMLGHTTMRMLYRRYAHFIRNRARQDGVEYEKAFRQAMERMKDANRPQTVRNN